MTEIVRRDPDELLTELKRDEARARRGRLKIFFGASAGVGKTFSMLESAVNARAAGVDVVVGYVEPHGRVETERLLVGLEQLPFLNVRYRSITRREFDLDAALKRAPAVLLVDELAHSNVVDGEPRPRHAKRWQDIEELLAAGISVWTTVNVQHLESLNDVVAGITGVRQQETIPDKVFDEADAVELIDLPPGELLARLKAGKVYLADQVGTATERFFREPNLLALRELALRRTADRVDAAARAYGVNERASKPWLARDRFLIAVAPDDQAEQLVRVGKRFADALDAEWLVVSVETPTMLKLGERARNRRIDVLRLAESLGAQTVTLDGPSASAALTEYARLRNVTRIVVGEPRRFGLRAVFRPSTANKLVQAGGGFDISVIARREPPSTESSRREMIGPADIHWNRYFAAIAISLACTAVAALMFPYLALTNLVMVYLLGATITALRLGRGPASLAAVVNIIAFDYCFVPPRFTLAVSDFQYLLTFAVMLAVALIIANLVASVRAQTRVAGARERRTALLYEMSRELAITRSLENLARAAVKNVAETFAARAVVLVPDSNGLLHHPHRVPLTSSLRNADLSVAQWVFDHNTAAGLGTDTLPAAKAQYLPLRGGSHTLGVLAVEPTQRRRLLLPEQRHLLETFAAQIALALERVHYVGVAQEALVKMESERLRNSLLAALSHDLRTPLTALVGLGESLTLTKPALSPAQLETAKAIADEARRINALVTNLLDMARIESGEVRLNLQWQPLEEVVGAALGATRAMLSHHVVEVRLPRHLPLVRFDAVLIERVLVNLLENASKYSPPGSTVTLSAEAAGDRLNVSVSDNGPGLPAGQEEAIFQKFTRGERESATPGVGLGLAICRAIVEAHHGTIVGMNIAGGGASFVFTLPLGDPPTHLPEYEAEAANE
jgi:two-component system sensor histidine kinase KdpD